MAPAILVFLRQLVKLAQTEKTKYRGGSVLLSIIADAVYQLLLWVQKPEYNTGTFLTQNMKIDLILFIWTKNVKQIEPLFLLRMLSSSSEKGLHSCILVDSPIFCI